MIPCFRALSSQWVVANVVHRRNEWCYADRATGGFDLCKCATAATICATLGRRKKSASDEQSDAARCGVTESGALRAADADDPRKRAGRTLRHPRQRYDPRSSASGFLVGKKAWGSAPARSKGQDERRGGIPGLPRCACAGRVIPLRRVALAACYPALAEGQGCS